MSSLATSAIATDDDSTNDSIDKLKVQMVYMKIRGAWASQWPKYTMKEKKHVLQIQMHCYGITKTQ